MIEFSSLIAGRKARSAVFAPEDPAIQDDWMRGSSPRMRDSEKSERNLPCAC